MQLNESKVIFSWAKSVCLSISIPEKMSSNYKMYEVNQNHFGINYLNKILMVPDRFLMILPHLLFIVGIHIIEYEVIHTGLVIICQSLVF